MRRFKICVLFFVAVVVVAQAAMAQSQQQYNLDGYKKDYKTGYASTVGAVTIQGQVFRPADGRFFFGYEGIELTLDGGADFTQTVSTGAEGEFTFKNVPVGSFTIFAHNSDTNAFGSVTVSLSRGTASISSSNATTFSSGSLKLLFTEDDLFILGTLNDDMIGDESACCPGAGTAGGSSGGGAFGGGMGMLAAGLGAAGLATGIAALGQDKKKQEVTVGYWSAR